ncbi:G-protein coupled receptor GRL101-like [Antedon mediterranea]|uniref:G-protein coupled receptor GRL101-like n=1 Tax=Antedon mediterranea TaxID=105859 RepID=UPI003AF7F702
MEHRWLLFRLQLATSIVWLAFLVASSCESHGSVVDCNPTTEVKCDAGGCVALNSTCNSISDCPDGSDESPRVCGCLPAEFMCSNSCISIYRRCDGICDCGVSCEDEDDCDQYPCPSTHMKCATTHVCIHLALQCDFNDDCGDGSDENCEHRSCYNLEFRCANGECLKPGYRCNGEVNCRGDDKSDEENCSEVVVCDGRRIFREHFCDFYAECSLSEKDEKQDCPCDPTEAFMCSTGRCFKRSRLCDGKCDCLGSCEDEDNCGSSVCVPGEDYFCSQSFRCLDAEFLCDSTNDCENKDDELCSSLYQSKDGYECKSENERENMCHIGNKPYCYPTNYYCDHHPQCQGDSDRSYCKENAVCSSNEYTCANGMCIKGSFRCDIYSDCLDHSDELNCESHQCEEGMWQCTSGHCIDVRKRCDTFVDCANFGPYRDGSDEENCNFEDCVETEFQCDSGVCIDSGSVCINDSYLPQCRDKSHLLECDDFECPVGYYKCQNSYCIPDKGRCNGYVECNLFWDDEVNCPGRCKEDFTYYSVPDCICNDKTIDCNGRPNVSKTVNFSELKHMNILKFSGTEIELTEETFINVTWATVLDLSRNNIVSVGEGYFKDMFLLQNLILSDNKIKRLKAGGFRGLSNLRHLNLTGNIIEEIEADAFFGLDSLTTLDLSYQNIKKLPINAFHGLRRLRSLNLRGNHLQFIVAGTFSGLSNLRSLDITENKINTVDKRAFNGLPSLQTLYTDEYRFCCVSNGVPNCFPEPDAFSSCDDLMSNYVLRISIWVLGATAFLGNLVVIIWRVTHSRDNKVHSFLITNLAAGDFCMGVYLLIIAIVDLIYRGEYIIHDKQWRSSLWCHFAGFLSTFSSELSVFSLTIITLQRLTSILFPFRSKNMELGWAMKMMVATWLLAIFLAVLPLCGIEYFGNFYGRSGVCLALHITGEKTSGWEYSVFIFLAINFVSFIIIIVSYVVMFVVARRTQRAVRPQNHNDSMAMRMTVIVMTDFCCWIPIIFLGISSLLGAPISPKVYAWIAVFVLPLNASVNPLLYTLWTSPYVRRFLKKARPSLRSLSTYYTDTRHTSVTEHHRSSNNFKLKTSQRSKKTSIKFSPPKNNNSTTKRMTDGNIMSDDEQCNKLLSSQRKQESFQ